MNTTKLAGINISIFNSSKSDFAEEQFLEIINSLRVYAKEFKLLVFEVEECKEYYIVSTEVNNFIEVLKDFLAQYDFISVADIIAYSGEIAKTLFAIDSLLMSCEKINVSSYYDTNSNIICINDIENEDEYIKVLNSL